MSEEPRGASPLLVVAALGAVLVGTPACRAREPANADRREPAPEVAATPEPAPAAERLEALDGPPAQAALAFVAALHLQDRQALLDTVSPSMASDLSSPQAADTLPMLAALFPAQIAVTRVVPHGEQQATVEMALTQQGVRLGAALEVSRVGERWKVSGASGDVGPAR